jgi:hypothetical protein
MHAYCILVPTHGNKNSAQVPRRRKRGQGEKKGHAACHTWRERVEGLPWCETRGVVHVGLLSCMLPASHVRERGRRKMTSGTMGKKRKIENIS